MARNKRRRQVKIGNNRLFSISFTFTLWKDTANSDSAQAVCILITSFQEWLETIAQRGPGSVARG